VLLAVGRVAAFASGAPLPERVEDLAWPRASSRTRRPALGG
jgi:hypothetical protein